MWVKYLAITLLLTGFFLDLGGELLAQNSDVIMKVVIDKKLFRYPEPVIIKAYLYGPNPVAGAWVSAAITAPSGKKITLPLSEDMLVDNMKPRNGEYAGVLADLDEDGEYRVHVQADDNDHKAHFAEGFIQDLPNPMPADESIRVVSDSFQVGHDTTMMVSGYSGRNGLPPLKITTLSASIDSRQCVRLQWMVPMNIGSGGQYEIRCSPRIISSEASWNEAKTVYAGKYRSKEGETQVQRICNLTRGTACFAVKSISRKGLRSERSNNYIVILK